jgi:hypothetical protein
VTHHKCLDLSKQIFLFEKLSDIKNQRISFKIIETTFVSKMFIKLERLLILRGLFNGVRLYISSPKKRRLQHIYFGTFPKLEKKSAMGNPRCPSQKPTTNN